MRTRNLSFLLLTITASLATAAPVVYNSLSSWQADGPQAGTIGFETMASTVQMQYSTFTLSGVTFSAIGANLVVYPSGYVWSDMGAGPSLTSNIAPSAILINLPSDIFGVGFLIGSGSSVPVNVTINGTTQLTITSPTNPPANLGNPAAFWGIRSDTAISNITIGASVTDYRAIIDNFTWGGAASGGGGGVVVVGGGDPGATETPEPAGALLIGGALLLLPLLRQRVRPGRR